MELLERYKKKAWIQIKNKFDQKERRNREQIPVLTQEVEGLGFFIHI
jgi:hypothetical protein